MSLRCESPPDTYIQKSASAAPGKRRLTFRPDALANKKTEWDKSDVLLNPYVFHLSFSSCIWLSALIEMD